MSTKAKAKEDLDAHQGKAAKHVEQGDRKFITQNWLTVRCNAHFLGVPVLVDGKAI